MKERYIYKDIQKDFYTWICLAWIQKFKTIFPPKVYIRIFAFPGIELVQIIKGFKQMWVSVRSTRRKSRSGWWKPERNIVWLRKKIYKSVCFASSNLCWLQMSFPQSGHRMSSRSVRKPRPTRDKEHFLQLKQSLCHCRSSKEMYFVPPSPVSKEK